MRIKYETSNSFIIANINDNGINCDRNYVFMRFAFYPGKHGKTTNQRAGLFRS